MESTANSFEMDKQRIIQWVLSLSEPQLLEKAKYLMTAESEADWWNDITYEERNAIQEGLAQINAGQSIPHFEVKKSYARWL